ncbi:MAG: class I tRNA ligase family protein [Patescibacteria group bacterium]
MRYDFKKIEKKWQKIWAAKGHKQSCEGPILRSSSFGGQRKKYVLDMFPYPSGSGLHVGHLVGYVGSDIISRFYRMKGCQILHPMGWDAFGLPAENYAIKNKIHPSIAVKENIKNFKEELNAIGFSYDWDKEINTTDPAYYKWTQWIFLQMFKAGLAYEAEVPVNWCPKDKTVLANEEVTDGRCDRCDSLVERKKLKQWILKITSYADRLLGDLEGLDWPERVKEMQRNWIGKSEGTLIKFQIPMIGDQIEVFTTRPDTIDGVTYLVIAPEHSLIENHKLKIKNYEEVKKYVETASHKTDLMRQEQSKEKTGVELKGIKAINPFNNDEISVWVADYVLGHYGSGAIMAVPQYDERDREFAQKFNLPVIDKLLVEFSGEKAVKYKLRDWIFSRQRYWGEPIPIIKCEKCGNQPVPEENLPVVLPDVESYEPTGEAESPLAVIENWVNVQCPKCGGLAKRETNTMPQWAGSCWYYLAYLMQGINNFKFPISAYKDIFKNWLPVDLYIGGVEHAVLHLLYVRFWHKFLYDIKAVPTLEPFQKLMNQGLIMGTDGQKMSKSRENTVSAKEITEEFGADSLRVYEMFMGPFGDSKPWDVHGIIGIERFLNRIHNLINPKSHPPVGGPNPNQIANNQKDRIEKLLNKTIKKVTEDIESFKFNTAISALMILVNEMEKNPNLKIENYKLIIKLLFPFVPHLAQELWEKLGNSSLLDCELWPQYDEKLIKEEDVELVVQINNKVRGRIVVKSKLSQKEVERLVFSEKSIEKWIQGNKIKKVIFISDKLINFII